MFLFCFEKSQTMLIKTSPTFTGPPLDTSMLRSSTWPPSCPLLRALRIRDSLTMSDLAYSEEEAMVVNDFLSLSFPSVFYSCNCLLRGMAQLHMWEVYVPVYCVCTWSAVVVAVPTREWGFAPLLILLFCGRWVGVPCSLPTFFISRSQRAGCGSSIERRLFSAKHKPVAKGVFFVCGQAQTMEQSKFFFFFFGGLLWFLIFFSRCWYLYEITFVDNNDVTNRAKKITPLWPVLLPKKPITFFIFSNFVVTCQMTLKFKFDLIRPT